MQPSGLLPFICLQMLGWSSPPDKVQETLNTVPYVSPVRGGGLSPHTGCLIGNMTASWTATLI